MPKRIIPPARGAGVVELDGVAEAAQVVGGGEPGRPGADHQDALAGGRRAAHRRSSPRRIASSPRKRSTALMPTASSSWPRLQAVSHGW